jgi:hypothetical protein
LIIRAGSRGSKRIKAGYFEIITYTLGFIGMLAEKVGKNNLSDKMIKNSNSILDKVLFYCYQIAKGIAKTLAYARTGIEEWQNIRHNKQYRQLELKFVS